MKFVFDPKTGQYAPEKYVNRVDNSDIEREVFSFLDRNSSVISRCSFATKPIATEIIRRSPNYDILVDHRNEVELAIKKWFAANPNKVKGVTEDAAGGGIGPATAVSVAPASSTPATIDALSISSPVLKPKDKKKKSSKEEIDLDDVPEQNKGGDCFQTAWKTFYDNLGKHPLLCHGIVTGQGAIAGVKYNHAWIEIGDQVIDRTMPIFSKGVSKDAYYLLGNIDDKLVFKYDSKQVSEKATEWMTYGPWEDILWQYP